jgi:hypothetical protein
MNTCQITKRKLTKQPNKNLPNNQIKTCQTTKLLLNSFLMVLTAVGQYAYKRPKDGVLVVPIGCLKE